MSTSAGRQSSIGVGIVGLSGSGGWAAAAHVPALAAVEGLELRGLVASSPASARAAADAHGVSQAFDSVEALAARDEIDLVVVSVRVPRHRELVLPALAAGKPVLCEWPLGRELDEAEQLTASAAEAGLPSFVGLQGRAAPSTLYLRDLIAEGYLGDVLSTTLVASAPPWGATTTTAGEYLLDRDQGATLLTILFGHAVDCLTMVLGEFTKLSATTATRRPQVRNTDTGELVAKTAEDQVLVTGVLESGAVAAIHFRGDAVPSLTWEIHGSEGNLQITCDAGNLHFGDLIVRGARPGETVTEITVPESYDQYPALASQPAHAVAHAYAQVQRDLRDGTATSPDFAHARYRHQLLDAIQRSAASGQAEALPAG